MNIHAEKEKKKKNFWDRTRASGRVLNSGIGKHNGIRGTVIYPLISDCIRRYISK